MNFTTFGMEKDLKYKEVIFDNNPIFYKYYEIYNPEKKDILAFPDGCVDIQLGMINGAVSIHFVGSYSEGGLASSSKFDKCFGVKLNPGRCPKVLQGKMDRLMKEMRINVLELLDVDIREATRIMGENVKTRERIAFFEKIFNKNVIAEKHDISTYIIDTLTINNGNVNIAEIIENLGYSHRYSDKVFKNEVGFSIKKYAGIYRLQEAINMLTNKDDDTYYDLGYYDQSHFIHDFKKFTSFTPNKFTKIISEVNFI